MLDSMSQISSSETTETYPKQVKASKQNDVFLQLNTDQSLHVQNLTIPYKKHHVGTQRKVQGIVLRNGVKLQ
jgi:hypothetical protein